MKSLCRKYRAGILYLLFGGCTTLVNLLCYFVFYGCLSMRGLTSAILAWFVSVLFAFVSNRTLVFASRASTLRAMLRELAAFFACRLTTGALDALIMAVTVDWMRWNGLLWKLFSNILVIALNYLASKRWIFQKADR